MGSRDYMGSKGSQRDIPSMEMDAHLGSFRMLFGSRGPHCRSHFRSRFGAPPFSGPGRILVPKGSPEASKREAKAKKKLLRGDLAAHAKHVVFTMREAHRADPGRVRERSFYRPGTTLSPEGSPGALLTHSVHVGVSFEVPLRCLLPPGTRFLPALIWGSISRARPRGGGHQAVRRR